MNSVLHTDHIILYIYLCVIVCFFFSALLLLLLLMEKHQFGALCLCVYIHSRV